MYNQMHFNSPGYIFDAKFLTRAKAAFTKRFGTKPDTVIFPDLDLINHRRDKGGMPDTQGMKLLAYPSTKQGWMLLSAPKAKQ